MRGLRNQTPVPWVVFKRYLEPSNPRCITSPPNRKYMLRGPCKMLSIKVNQTVNLYADCQVPQQVVSFDPNADTLVQQTSFLHQQQSTSMAVASFNVLSQVDFLLFFGFTSCTAFRAGQSATKFPNSSIIVLSASMLLLISCFSPTLLVTTSRDMWLVNTGSKIFNKLY